eukprot:6184495-Pleurochrysis_carterae.AAC.1
MKGGGNYRHTNEGPHKKYTSAYTAKCVMLCLPQHPKRGRSMPCKALFAYSKSAAVPVTAGDAARTIVKS